MGRNFWVVGGGCFAIQMPEVALMGYTAVLRGFGDALHHAPTMDRKHEVGAAGRPG